MRKFITALSMTGCLFLSFLSISCNAVEAKNTLDLLALPAKESALASKSVLLSLTSERESIIAVGERGHIINWQSTTQWQQQKSPVSVTITDVTILTDGSKIAVGHNGAILKAAPDSTLWRKVFTGAEITRLKIESMQKQYETLQQVINKTQDEDELEELTFQLDDLAFFIEESQLELESGPNKPLLSVTRTSNDTLFAGGAYGTLLTSKDKGETWQLIGDRLDNPDSYHLNSVITTSNDQLFIVGENGTAFQSDNIGQTWSAMTLPYSGSLFGIIANIDNSNKTNAKTQLVAFGLQGNLMVSLDGGRHWQHKKLPTSASLLGGNFSQQGQAYLVGHGGIIVNFIPSNLESLNIKKHPSGAALSSVYVKEDSLILAGQFGISQWLIKE